MKRALVSVLRLTVFFGVLVLLLFINEGLKAQYGNSTCATFASDPSSPCPTCCSTHGEIPGLPYETNSTGTQSIQDVPYSCGTAIAGSGCSVACSGSTPQAVSDSSCCIAGGLTCASNEPCCPGTICLSSGSCGACVDAGDACGATSDCCSGTCASGICKTSSGGGGTGGCGSSDALSDSSSALAVSPDQLCGPSPIVLDIDGRGFFLTSAENGVRFDISGTGHPIQMGWTAQGADNAFLALPASDGLIHDGKQLFGNFTPQPPSKTPNGFAALAVYDLPANGGNGDGIIDKRDAIFSWLRLWIDLNHDGISQPNEIFTLPALGINSISLHYTEDRKTDQYGNQFRYRARLNVDKPDDAGKIVYDVFFVTPDSTAQAQLRSIPATVPLLTSKR